MTDALSEQTGTSKLPFSVGDAVYISRGALSGLRGTVQSFTDRSQCVLVIDGLAEGVQIAISPGSITGCSDSSPRPRPLR
jgi:hypothetical protein